MTDFDGAASFVTASARVLDRRRFERLFRDGPAQPVRDAVAAYRNSDGGFGHALEPDCRCSASQPAAVEMALRIMHECDAWDAALVSGAEADWRGFITVDTLRVLRANGLDSDWGECGSDHTLLGSLPHSPNSPHPASTGSAVEEGFHDGSGAAGGATVGLGEGLGG